MTTETARTATRKPSAVRKCAQVRECASVRCASAQVRIGECAPDTEAASLRLARAFHDRCATASRRGGGVLRRRQDDRGPGSQAAAASRSVLGSGVGVRRPFPSFLIPNRVPHGFTQDPSTVLARYAPGQHRARRGDPGRRREQSEARTACAHAQLHNARRRPRGSPPLGGRLQWQVHAQDERTHGWGVHHSSKEKDRLCLARSLN